MNRKSGSGSGLFLMEMLVAAGFFIICSSICVMVFVKADRISRNAWDMNHAVEKAQSLAEELKAGQELQWSEMLPDRDIWGHMAEQSKKDKKQTDWYEELRDSDGYEGMYTMYWGKDWQPEKPSSSPPYLGIISRGKVDGIERVDILIMSYGNDSNKGNVLYRLQTESYAAPRAPVMNDNGRKEEADGTEKQK